MIVTTITVIMIMIIQVCENIVNVGIILAVIGLINFELIVLIMV